MSHLNFWILVPLLDRKLQVFRYSSNWLFLGIFNELLSTQKCKRSSLRSQCWMRLFRRFSNTVGEAGKIVLHTEPNDWPSTFNWCHFQSELKFHALFHSPIHFVPFHLDQFLRCKTHCDKQIIFGHDNFWKFFQAFRHQNAKK